MHKRTVVDFKTLGKRYLFENPYKELIAKTLDQVIPLLEEVECYQARGFYVVGYLSYEAAKAFEDKFTVKTIPLSAEYLAYFTVHSDYIESELPTTYLDVDMPQEWLSPIKEADYERAISQIKNEIRQGNTYQVNYTIPLEASVSGDHLAIYNRLVVEQAAAYNAYIEHDDFTIISISPELFFEKQEQTLITRPMKGTTTRGLSYQEDLQEKEWLSQDTKNRAENMMIVDLLRNDMGRISETNSVKVTKLCDLEQYSTVWQMTSTIESKLSQDKSLAQIFQALFPCGSITGAPKISTMAIIDRLEPQPRGVYCGSIGICLPSGRAIFNVAIRTLQIHDQAAVYGVGGGITWDSNWQDEYQETKQKSAILYRKQAKADVITTGLVNGGQLTFLEQHLDRLQGAARYFSYPFNRDFCQQTIAEQIKPLEHSKDYRFKILLSKSGDLAFDIGLLKELDASFLEARLVRRQEKLASPYTTFKTSYRPHIPQSSHEQIFISSQGYLLETSIGNLVLELNGQLYTPSLTNEFLNGIYRQYLLKNGRVTEKPLKEEDLFNASRIFVCNSLRGLYQLSLCNQG